jgi:arylsulfatase A-like enzyme
MNVIVICSDTFRHDHLGFLKKQPTFTPNLDRFASESAHFSDFWLCSFPTLVNRMDVFTGRYAFPLFKWGPLPQQFPVLAEVFTRHGFETALISDNPHMNRPDFGFGRGFGFVKAVPGQIHDKFQPKSTPMIDLPCPVEKLGMEQERLDQYRRNAWWYRQEGVTTTELVFREAMEWFTRPRKKFFLWIDAFDPHDPWDAAEAFQKFHPLNPQGDAVIWPKPGVADFYSPADLENIRSLYRAEVSQTDYWFGRLFDLLRDRDLLGQTAVVFCSDHGYYLGEHNIVGKPVRLAERTAIYEELGHLPLLVRHPQRLAAGQTLRGLCQPPDLFATALELAQIPRVPWAQGHSLVARLAGEPDPQQFAIGGYHPHRGRVSCLSVWTNEWALMYSPTGGLANSELFHVPTDPTHTRNVIGQHHDVAQELVRLLDNWLDSLDVSAGRKRQLLYAAPFTVWNKLVYSAWLYKNRLSYSRRFRHYASTPANGEANP